MRRVDAPEERNQVPWPLAVPATVAVAFLLLPLLGLLVRAPWRSLAGSWPRARSSTRCGCR